MSSKERIGIILDVDAEVSKAKGNIGSLTKIFEGVGGNKGNQLRDLLSDISAEYEKLANESGKTISKVGDFTKAEKSSERLSQLLRRLDKEVVNIGKSSKSDLSKFFPPEVADRVKKASDAVKTYNTILENSSKKKGAIGAAADEYEKQERAARKAAEALKDLQDIQQGKSQKQAVTSDVKVKKQESLTAANADVKKYSAELEAAQKAMDEFKVRKADLFTKGTQNKSSEFRTLRDDLAAAENNFKTATDKAADLRRELKNMVVVGDLDAQIEEAEQALKDAQAAANQLKQNLDNVTASEFSRAFDEAKKKLEGMSGIDLSKITNIDDLNNLLQRFTNEGIQGLEDGLRKAGIEIRDLGNANVEVSGKVRSATADFEAQNRAIEDVNGIKNRILQFFSLTNGVMLARRVLTQATESIKELDAAMTETATVTDFSVGDMWEALPQYTQTANELGATTLGAYETMTLFYQQGLNTNEVFEIGTETMKMARIAGLDYAEATDLMTAALRGFNMELNETSAARINDVYSELAAITAADTEEIATAMTKTASIADSANMEFETTAALLSQIIETTREPAETAGTAMKTIIARFTEMKKATSDLINIDGEEVSVNKVETALKSAGVALRDVNGEFRDLDDVFLELSSRWNSLDKMTQRYVATMAAGSRQQSRFIAMMQNYDRTLELVDAAYDSAGASAQQFAKTQDSFEAKTNKLNNAWNEYLLSLANSDMVKGFITVLTELLNILNDLTEGGGAFFSSLLKIFTAVSGFKILRNVFQQSFSSLSGLFTKEGQKAGNNFSLGVQNGLHNLKIKFPFIGTLQKELRNVKREIKALQAEGTGVTLGKMSSILKHNPTVTTQLSGNLGQVVNNYLQQQLNEIGTLTDEGQQWANELIDGFVAELQSGTEIDQALQNLNSKINNGLIMVTPEVDTGMVDANGNPIIKGGEKTTNTKLINPTNKGVPKNIDTNNAPLNFNNLKDMEQKTAQVAAALTTVGMAVSALGSKLSDEAGALGVFGDSLEVTGNAASSAGMALMAFNAVAKMVPKIMTAAGGYLGIILAAATAVISAIVGIIQKSKEAKEEAQQLTLDTAKETRDEVEANRELADTLDATVKAYQEGAASRDEVASAAEELLTKYDLENEKVTLLTGNYEALAEAIREKRKAEEESNIEAQSNAMSTSIAQLTSGGIEQVQTLKHGASWGDEVELTDDFSSRTDELIKNSELTDIVSVGKGGTLSFSKSISEFTDEELSKLSTFLNKYYIALGDALKDQGLTPEDSEVYLHLSEIIGNTSTAFEEFKTALDSSKDSLINLAKFDFEKNFDFSTINDYGSYKSGKQEYIRLLKEADNSLTYEEAQQLARDYFSSKTETATYAQADELILELQAKFGTDNLAALSIYEKYLNGEISAEEFVSLLISVDLETKNNIAEVDKEVQKNHITSAIKAPQTFHDASLGITEYINENFTIDGIDDKVLEDFESQLKVINGTLPRGINLLEDWEDALQQGTLGISSFMVNVQSLLNEQSLLLSESAVNADIYGLGRTDEEIKADLAEYNALSGDEIAQAQKKQEIADKYGITPEQLQSGWDLYNLGYEEQYKQLQTTVASETAVLEQNAEYQTRKARLGVIDDEIVAAQEDYDSYTIEKPAGQGMPIKAYRHTGRATNGGAEIEIAEGVTISHMPYGQNTTGRATVNGKEYVWDPVNQPKSENSFTQMQDEGENKGWYYIVPTGANIDDIPQWEKYNEEQPKKNAAKTKLDGLKKEKTDIEAQVTIDEQSLTVAKQKLENLESKKEIKFQIEIEGALREATQIATLQTQLQQLKELTKDGFKVDLSTFNQMKAIAPEIAHGIKVMTDGTLDVSAGMAMLNEQLAAQIGLKGANAKATLQQAIAEETALQGKLQAAIDAINAELTAMQKGNQVSEDMKEGTEEALSALAADGAYQRALLADEEATDQTEAAQRGANNVISTVEGMDEAYQKLGQTLDGIHAKMQTIGTSGYKAGAITGTYSFETAKGKIETVDVTPTVNKEVYTADEIEGWITEDTNLSNNQTERKEQLEATKEYLSDLLDNSYERSGTYASTLAGMLGGGDNYGNGLDSGSGKNTELEKESDRIKAKIDELDSAIENLADNDIVDMQMINQLIEQKIALQKEYKKALERELEIISATTDEIWNDVKKAGNDKYIKYNEETGSYGYTDAYYEDFFKDGVSIDSEQMQKVQEQASQLNKLNSDQLANQIAIKELVDNLVENQAENYNAERSLKGRERRQTEADQEEELIGMLPEEIQPFFQALNTAEDAYLEMQEIQANKVLAENLQQQLDAAYAGVPDYIKENMTFDEYSGYGIDLAKINQIEDKEAREEMLTAVQENAKILNEQYFDPLYDVKEQLSGGKLQRAILNTGKSLQELAKEISDGDIDTGLKKINTGFKALDDALNSFIKNLEDNEAIENILSTKVLPSLNLDEEQATKLISNPKLQKALQGNVPLQNFVLQAIGTEGIDLGAILGAAFGQTGGLLEQIGGFLNFDMMKILGDGGGLIEQGKQIVEQIVGKIAEITGALIDAWTNREDILYNFLNVLEKYLHDYEVMQRYSTQLEKGRMASVDDIRQNWEQQWQSLQDQLEMQQERIETRQDQLDRSRWNPFQLISGWDPTSDSLYENRGVKMAFDLLISAIGMLPMGLGAFGGQLNQLYEDYDKRVQEAYEDRLAAEMAILDIEDERLELVKIGAEEATEFEQKVLEALVQKEQEQIDELSRLNDAITDANSKLISTLQKNLDQIRQDRENEKKEEELGEKERRLAYLRQNTSGANMMEIKKLEEELEEGHEDYTDTLIDQKISELEKQNEAAAEQRQQQIDLLQAQLDWSQKYGLYWDAIYGMLYTIDESGNAVLNPENFDLDGNIRENSQLAQMLGTFSDRLGMSVWSSVLDNEEAKRLGRYYGAFIGNNGISGEWADYWALLNPGADDPDYATPMPEIPDGIWGVLYRIETSIGKYFGSSNMGLWNAGERLEVGLKNILGDVFNIEEWANATAKGFHREDVIGKNTLTLMNDWNKLSEGLLGIADFGNKTSQSLTNRAGYNRHQNNGDNNISNYFNIGTVGENISLDDMVDKVSSALREVFSAGTNIVHHGR